MKRKCPRCLAESPSAARFCGRCGLSLTPGPGGQLAAGRIVHPHPAAAPDGFAPCSEAEHLYYRWGPPSGQSFLLGTEPIAVALFNGAYPLEEVQVVICGKDDQGWVRFSVTQTVETLPVDLAGNARSLGAHVFECTTYDEFVEALGNAKTVDHTVVIYVENDRYVGVPGYDSWWDVPPAEVSEMDSVQQARQEWERMRATERDFL